MPCCPHSSGCTPGSHWPTGQPGHAAGSSTLSVSFSQQSLRDHHQGAGPAAAHPQAQGKTDAGREGEPSMETWGGKIGEPRSCLGSCSPCPARHREGRGSQPPRGADSACPLPAASPGHGTARAGAHLHDRDRQHEEGQPNGEGRSTFARAGPCSPQPRCPVCRAEPRPGGARSPPSHPGVTQPGSSRRRT